MKKVLLSLSMLAAVFAVNAQTKVAIYGGGIGNINDAVNSADGFASFKADANANPPTVVPSDWSNAEEVAAGERYLRLKGTGTYYVWGASNGSYSAAGALQSFGYTGDATGFVAFRAKGASDKTMSKLKIGFITVTDSKTFSAEIFEENAYMTDPNFQLSPGNWKTYNVPLTSFYYEDASGNKLDANGNKLVLSDPVTKADSAKFVKATAAQIKDFGQINLILNVQSCTWNPNANGGNGACDVAATPSDVSVDDIYITQSKLASPIAPIGTGTQSAAANIASTKVFPNPATEAGFTAEVTVKNNATASVILTDMMGKQIATKAVDANGQANFATSGLAAGMYTVTYVLDGTPAKTELVVVK